MPNKMTPKQEFYMTVVSTIADGIFNGLAGGTDLLKKSPEEILRTGIVGAMGLFMSQTDMEKNIKKCMGCTKKCCDRCGEPQSKLMMAAVSIARLQESEQKEIAKDAWTDFDNKQKAQEFSDIDKFL